jgi:hypothetical protein
MDPLHARRTVTLRARAARVVRHSVALPHGHPGRRRRLTTCAPRELDALRLPAGNTWDMCETRTPCEAVSHSSDARHRIGSMDRFDWVCWFGCYGAESHAAPAGPASPRARLALGAGGTQLDAAALRWAAAIVRDRRHIGDRDDLQAHR